MTDLLTYPWYTQLAFTIVCICWTLIMLFMAKLAFNAIKKTIKTYADSVSMRISDKEALKIQSKHEEYEEANEMERAMGNSYLRID